ncbi:MAG: phytanoyl-CoA dioxygenase family protein [Cytophagia bacterium]|nr:phytanoyl-CoA dioxygenase family protein [Cytophagia bacterium]
MIEQTNIFEGFPDLIKYSDTRWTKERAKLEEDGFFILNSFFDKELIDQTMERLNLINQRQIDEIGGVENMRMMKEENIIRVPFLYDDFFLKFFTNQTLLEIIKSVFCDEFILLVQNALINEPEKSHNAVKWHKDLPYQHFSSKQPICLNALIALTDFSPKTGSTCFVKGSHQIVEAPSDEEISSNLYQVEAPAGSVIIFNSLTLHKMGHNSSGKSRYAINHIFGTPVFKPHFNFRGMLNGKYENDPVVSKLLDYHYSIPESVVSYRKRRLEKFNNSHGAVK